MSVTKKPYWALMNTYLRPQWPAVLLLAFLLAGDIGVQIINPQILRIFIDAATSKSTFTLLFIIGLIFIGLALVQQFFGIFAAYVGEGIGWTATNQLRSDLVLKCLEMDRSFHQTHSPGELLERIDGDVTQLANFFSVFVIQVLGNALFIFGALFVLFSIDWRVGSALTAFVIVTILVLSSIRGLAVEHWVRARQASAKLYGFLEERLAGTEDIRSNGANSYIIGQFSSLMHNLLKNFRKARLRGNAAFIVISIIFVLGEALGLGLGAFLLSAKAISIGTVYLIDYYILLLNIPLNELTRQLQDFQKASASVHRISELQNTERVLLDGPGVHFSPGPVSVEFDNVTFGYDNQIPVLQNISFRMEAGQVLGLLGATGSGKTTIARLLLRFYDPDFGVIRLAQQDIRQARLSELAQNVGMVTQDVQLFHATIRDNVTFFSSDIPDEYILDIFKQLGVWEWYQNLPDGLDTVLASHGNSLSAGEAQLLALTRIFLRNPGLVILDEASSRLDPVTERLLEHGMSKLLVNRTGIVIAHHLATVMRADLILIIENGQICEFGYREELSQNPHSRFSHLLQTGLKEVLP